MSAFRYIWEFLFLMGKPMNDKLKPCPFCGGKAEFILEGIVIGRVRCSHCRISQTKLKTKKKAIKSWNRRAEK